MLLALPNDVMSKIQCGELHSELFGCRHSMLQSHGLFALAKLLLNHCKDKICVAAVMLHVVTNSKYM